MGIFKRKFLSTSLAKVPEEFQRLSLREVIITNSYFPEVFVHIEKDEKNYLRAKVSGNWYLMQCASRAAGTEIMNQIRVDVQSAKSAGLIPQDVHIPGSQTVNGYGFAEVDFSNPPTKDATYDYVFTLGREIDDRIKSGSFQMGVDEIKMLDLFFSLAPIRVGYFGSYKFILKSITESFSENLAEMDPSEGVPLAIAIGHGYGHLEGFISHVNRSPQDGAGSYLDEVSEIPELNGYRYPRLKTIQYLLRKGWRFLDYLESQADPLITTWFKIGVLQGVDTFHQETDLPEERFLENQQLTTRIIYSEDGLATRDRESRKVELGSRQERHNLAISEEFISGLSPFQLDTYKFWIGGIEGGNSAVTLYALALSQVIPGAEFNWTPRILKSLFNSESQIARKAIRDSIESDLSLLQSMPATAIAGILDTDDLRFLDKILAELELNLWSHTYRLAINLWVEDHGNRYLNETELKIATAFLLFAWTSIGNGDWGDRPEDRKRDILFFQVAQQSKLEPFAPWRKVLDSPPFYRLISFFGVETDKDYPRGLLDVLDIRNEEMLAFFGRGIAERLTWVDNASAESILSAFYHSTKPGAIDLVWTILGGLMIDPEKQEAFLEHLYTLDPSGAHYLRCISFAIDLKNDNAVLGYLISLSGEAKDPFWRRNKTEMQNLLMTWKDFPTLLWTNLDKIPAKTVEKLRNYEGLNSKVLEQITPGSVARMSTSQIEYFEFMLSENPAICSNVSMLRAMLIAPSASINEIAAKYVKSENKYEANWLLMLESNLPITQQAALRYLETQVEARDFSSKLLMALDSNNQGARKLALSVLSKIKTPSVLSSVVDGLVENRNTDTWKTVSKNLSLVSDVDKYKEFTSQVFLTRRKARTVKEEIKIDIERLIEDISEAVEKDTLIRMAHSSVAADRDWALKQIALTAVEIDGVTVERAWKRDLNV